MSDDKGRSAHGIGWMQDLRPITNLIYYFFSLDKKIVDLHPFPLLVSIALLSLTSYLIITIIFKGKWSALTLALSLFVGVNPFMQAVLVWKYDCVSMVLSLFISCVPLYFFAGILKDPSKVNIIKPLFISCLCVTSTFFLYGHANGAYIILTTYLAIEAIVSGMKFKVVIKVFYLFVGAYIISCLFYGAILKLFFPNTRSDIPFTVSESYIFHAVGGGVKVVIDLFAMQRNWGILMLVCLVIFLINLGRQRHADKMSLLRAARNVLLGVAFVITALTLYRGAYSIINTQGGTYCISLSVFFAIIAAGVYNFSASKKHFFGFERILKNKKVLLVLPVVSPFCLLLVFITFNFATIQALNFQTETKNKIYSELGLDISRIEPSFYTDNFQLEVHSRPGYGILPPQTKLYLNQFPGQSSIGVLARSNLSIGFVLPNRYQSRLPLYTENEAICDSGDLKLDTAFYKIYDNLNDPQRESNTVCVWLKDVP
jgi:hypothetical protein